MNDFCPDGYVRSQYAVFTAAKMWFPEQIAALETATESQSETKPDNSIQGLRRVFSQPQLPNALQLELRDTLNQTTYRLRNFLHQGGLNAYYFGDDGRHSVSRDFWATTQADGVLESGTYWPYGKPPRAYEPRPNYRLFLRQSELDALLTERLVKKRPFPRAKMPDLLAALRKLDDLPNRKDQFRALCEMTEFREFKITNPLFREAARLAPRGAGRKSRRQS